MKKFFAAIALCGLVLVANVAQAAVTAEVGADGLFTLNGTGEQLAGMDFQSPGGLLTPAADASPFLFLLANTSNAVTYAIIPGTVTIEGAVKLNSGYTGSQADADSDLVAVAGIGGEQVSVPVSVVPEPATGLMAAFAALGLLGFRRRR